MVERQLPKLHTWVRFPSPAPTFHSSREIMTAGEKYQRIAEQWDRDGRPASALEGGYPLITLRSWTYSEGAKAEGISDIIRAFVRASEDAQHRDWLDAYFSDQESCRGCGESYRFENVSICTA